MSAPIKIKPTRHLFNFWQVVFALTLLAALLWFGSQLKSVVSVASSSLLIPFQYLGAKVASLGEIFSQDKLVSSDTEHLQTELSQTGLFEAQLMQLAEENAFLKSQLGLKERAAFVPYIASIINSDALGFVDFVRITVGSEDGVSEAMNVIGSSQVLVGKVGKVYNNTSQVVLLSDPQSRVSAKTETAQGIIIGQLGAPLILDLVPKHQQLQIGDLVVSSGLDGLYVPDLPIGRVVKVININSQVWQQAIVEPLVNYRELNKVLVIKGLQ